MISNKNLKRISFGLGVIIGLIILSFPFKPTVLTANDKGYILAYAKDRVVQIYEKASQESNIVSIAKIGQRFIFREPLNQKINWDLDKWIYIPANATAGESGWVHRESLVTEFEFSKINESWPFRHLAFEAGDVLAVYKFKSDGKTFSKQILPNGTGHLYRAGKIVVVKSDIGDVAAFEYDSKNMLLCPTTLDSCKNYINDRTRGFWVFSRFSDKKIPINYGGRCILDCT